MEAIQHNRIGKVLEIFCAMVLGFLFVDPTIFPFYCKNIIDIIFSFSSNVFKLFHLLFSGVDENNTFLDK